MTRGGRVHWQNLDLLGLDEPNTQTYEVFEKITVEVASAEAGKCSALCLSGGQNFLARLCLFNRGDLFGASIASLKLEGNHVDQMFVFGSAVGAMYRKYIFGKIVPIGSFKNNLVPITKSNKQTVAYISTYRKRRMG